MTASLIAFPAAHSQRLLSHVTLLTLDGAHFATAGFLPGDPGAAWAWIQSMVAREVGCFEEEVGCAEQDEGEDMVTVDGVPVYMVEIKRPVRFSTC